MLNIMEVRKELERRSSVPAWLLGTSADPTYSDASSHKASSKTEEVSAVGVTPAEKKLRAA